MTDDPLLVCLCLSESLGPPREYNFTCTLHRIEAVTASIRYSQILKDIGTYYLLRSSCLGLSVWSIGTVCLTNAADSCIIVRPCRGLNLLTAFGSLTAWNTRRDWSMKESLIWWTKWHAYLTPTLPSKRQYIALAQVYALIYVRLNLQVAFILLLYYIVAIL